MIERQDDHPAMTVLIALDLNHTLQYVIIRERGIIKAKVVVLIALLALARKVIVSDVYDVSPPSVAPPPPWRWRSALVDRSL
jgi:hypothetical protein